MLLRNVAAAVAAACTGSFLLLMDCNPSLFCYDQLLQVTASAPRREAITAGATGSPWCRRTSGYHNFENQQCVWILGASSGIGREMAEQLAVAGCQHLVLSSRSSQKLQEVADQCRILNPACRLTVLPVNVCDLEELQQAVRTVSSLPLDMVVMNAGVGQLTPALETDVATTERVLRSNALWPMLLTPLLFASRSSESESESSDGGDEHAKLQPSRPLPHLVVTSSIAGKLAVPLSAVYAASKFAVQGYFMSLACERPDLRIDLLCPGPVDTEFHLNNKNSNENDEVKTDEPSSSSSKLKMPVNRCVALMLSAMQRQPLSLLLQLQFQEVWIAPQPSLTALYLQQWFPGLQRRILGIVGPKRVQMWREGLDLYDPASWQKMSSSLSKKNRPSGSVVDKTTKDE
jgi:dehydrogenase/reductase SDR family protein 7